MSALELFFPLFDKFWSARKIDISTFEKVGTDLDPSGVTLQG